MQLGVDSFVENRINPDGSPVPEAVRVEQLMEEFVVADESGLDAFALGEHHRPDFVSSSPSTLLAAAAVLTKRIRLASAVTVLGSEDPIRAYQQFATVDLLSKGRAEIVVGRGSFVESFPLFGLPMEDYDLLFAEKLSLLLAARASEKVTWQGTYRPALNGESVVPRAFQSVLPVSLGVGGSPASFVRAGRLGLPLNVAIIGGDPGRFKKYVDLYKQEGLKAGHPESSLTVSVHSHGHVAASDEAAVQAKVASQCEIMNRIGRERGWSPMGAEHFEEERKSGSLYVGSPETVAAKIARTDAALGGLHRFTLLMDGVFMRHEDQLESIRLFGTAVKGLVTGTSVGSGSRV